MFGINLNEWGIPQFPVLTEDKTGDFVMLCEEVKPDDTILQFPIYIDGSSKRPDSDADYHITISWTENKLPDEELIAKVDQALQGLNVSKPKITTWQPDIFGKDKNFYVLVLPKTEQFQKLREAILPILNDGWGKEHLPHITVEKPLWDRIKKDYIMPNDLDVRAGFLELKRGNKLLARYK